jgi:DNA-binding transcriptional regulator LsrR (DeoR family)
MARRKTESLDMLTAAFLAGEGRKQKEIAQVLNTSQANVSRLIGEARKHYLKEEIHFVSDTLDARTMFEIHQRISRKELDVQLARLSGHSSNSRGPLLRVFPVRDLEDRVIRTAEFARQAAPYIRNLIGRSSNCGVTWGGMLWSLVQALRNLPTRTPWRGRQYVIDVIPLCGEPLGKMPTSHSSSNLANEFGRLANGEKYLAPSIGMVPAFIPAGLNKAELNGVKKLIDLVTSYQEIFGVHRSKRVSEPLADKLDMILTSVGPAERPLAFGKDTLFSTGDLTLSQLSTLIIGDMGGVCIPRAGLKKHEAEKLKKVDERWTGLRRSHLEKCAKRASDEPDPFRGRPGVVVISIGKDRAQFIYEAVKLGLINHLIIDDQLEVELKRIVSSEPKEGLHS